MSSRYVCEYKQKKACAFEKNIISKKHFLEFIDMIK